MLLSSFSTRRSAIHLCIDIVFNALCAHALLSSASPADQSCNLELPSASGQTADDRLVVRAKALSLTPMYRTVINCVHWAAFITMIAHT